MISYKKSASGYFVYDNEILVGVVKLELQWTVRGNRRMWYAYHKGTCKGSANTRNGAAEHLKGL